MSFLIIKLHEEKLHRVSPNVVSNFFEPTLLTACRIQHVGLCIMGYKENTGNNTLLSYRTYISYDNNSVKIKKNTCAGMYCIYACYRYT